MEWHEVGAVQAGPKMLFPMAWSLLPLFGGSILLFTKGGLLPIIFLAAGVMLSFFAVFLGTQIVPGKIDMFVLLVSPFVSFIMFFRPPDIVVLIMALATWILNYKTASLLSRTSATRWRCEWDPRVPLPEVSGAVYFHRRWAARPLMRIKSNIVRGVRIDDRVMLESFEPFTFDDSEQ
jgi:hypothetical protein